MRESRGEGAGKGLVMQDSFTWGVKVQFGPMVKKVLALPETPLQQDPPPPPSPGHVGKLTYSSVGKPHQKDDYQVAFPGGKRHNPKGSLRILGWGAWNPCIPGVKHIP